MPRNDSIDPHDRSAQTEAMVAFGTMAGVVRSVSVGDASFGGILHHPQDDRGQAPPAEIHRERRHLRTADGLPRRCRTSQARRAG